ncbi:MAG: hypothetical protein KDA46_00445 [Parvularculaceae bacterium]|nr:hypothetical protein [Parvularculaceae bacterium]
MKILTVLVALAAAAFVSNYKLTVAVDDHLIGEDLIGCYQLAGGADEIVDPFRDLVCKAQRDFRFDSAACLMHAVKFTARDDFSARDERAIHVEQAEAVDEDVLPVSAAASGGQ